MQGHENQFIILPRIFSSEPGFHFITYFHKGEQLLYKFKNDTDIAKVLLINVNIPICYLLKPFCKYKQNLVIFDLDCTLSTKNFNYFMNNLQYFNTFYNTNITDESRKLVTKSISGSHILDDSYTNIQNLPYYHGVISYDQATQLLKEDCRYIVHRIEIASAIPMYIVTLRNDKNPKTIHHVKFYYQEGDGLSHYENFPPEQTYKRLHNAIVGYLNTKPGWESYAKELEPSNYIVINFFGGINRLNMLRTNLRSLVQKGNQVIIMSNGKVEDINLLLKYVNLKEWINDIISHIPQAADPGPQGAAQAADLGPQNELYKYFITNRYKNIYYFDNDNK